MDVTTTMNSFRNFLNISWNGLPDFIKNTEESSWLIDDWYQTNWETLVETNINQIIEKEKLPIGFVTLEAFGSGADCNGSSSRVFNPNALATHYIQVNNIYRFDSFGELNDKNYYEISYPFNFAKVIDEQEIEIILPASNLIFKVVSKK
jgi:hypothetical protein